MLSSSKENELVLPILRTRVWLMCSRQTLVNKLSSRPGKSHGLPEGQPLDVIQGSVESKGGTMVDQYHPLGRRTDNNK